MIVRRSKENPGIELEKKVTKLFKMHGYNTKHDVDLIGNAGTPHQIDVYCTGKNRSIIIECKDMQNNISKKDITDFAYKLKDLQDKANMGIFITTSDFSSGANNIANQYDNIQLWNGKYIRKQLKEIPDEIPIISTDDYKIIPYNKTEKYVTDHSKPSRFNPRYWFKSIEIIAVPFLRPLYVIYLKGNNKCIIIDGNTGDIIRYHKGKITYMIYRDFDANEIELMKHIRSRFQKRDLKIPNMTKNNIQTGIDRLHNKRYIRMVKKRPITYDTKIPKNILQMFDVNFVSSVLPRFDYCNSNTNKHDITFDIQDIKESLARLYQGIIDRYEIVYYPMFMTSIYHKNVVIKKICIDGINGKKLAI